MENHPLIKRYASLIALAVSVVLSPWGIMRLLPSFTPIAVGRALWPLWFISLAITIFISGASLLSKGWSVKLVNGLIFGISFVSLFLFGIVYYIGLAYSNQASPSAYSTSPPVSQVTSTRGVTATSTLPQPQNVKAIVSAAGIMAGVNLSWTGPEPHITGVTVYAYDIYRSTSPGFAPSSSTKIAEVDSLSILDASVRSQPGTYYYVIQAQDQEGNMGPISSQLKVVVPQS